MKVRHARLRIWRVLKAIWRLDICRLQALGMLNICYIRPKLSHGKALHRQLWWRTRYKLPVLLWLPLELWRWIYWQLWAAPRQIRQAVLKYGPEIEVSHGIALAEQRQNITYWVRAWTVSPEYAYSAGLFKPKADGLNVILSAEIQPFHRLMNERRGVMQADYRLLGDKRQLTDTLSAHGIPMPAIFADCNGDIDELREAIAASGPVFCKLRSGSRGESAFMAECVPTGLIGQTLAGKTLANEAEVAAAWDALAEKGAVLIQPFLRNHPLLQALCPDANSITLRIISRQAESGIEVWAGLLYVQVPGEFEEKQYWLLNIDTEAGRAFDAFGHWFGSEIKADDSTKLMLDGQAVPYWQDIARYSKQAHAEMPAFWAIAWDWIVTPDGPRLLEGNSGWDLSPWQQLGVDFTAISAMGRDNHHVSSQ